MKGLNNLQEQPCTLEYVRLRCIEQDGCWTWAGSKKQGRWPILFLRRPDINGDIKDHQLYVRHLVLWLDRGKRPGVSKTRCVTTTCDNEQCVNPKHLKIVTRSEVNQKTAGYQGDLATRAKMAKSRRKGSKLSDDDVRAIRDSDGTSKDVAAKYGITQQYVCMLRAGIWRKDYANPFSGLMVSASNDSRKAA